MCLREFRISKFPGGGWGHAPGTPQKERPSKIIPACYAELPKIY